MSFSTLQEADAAAVARMADGTYVSAYSARRTDGTIILRGLLPLSVDSQGATAITGTNQDSMSRGGSWEEVTE